jgi:hypothetical protein
MGQGFDVLKVVELIRPSALGGVEKFYRHTIRTRGGTVLTVDVDERDFTVEKVAPILAKRATDADKILSL